MPDIRKHDGAVDGKSRHEAMTELRKAMRQQNECLQDKAHCDNARKAIIKTMHSVMKLDQDYFTKFFKGHQEFAANFNDYKYVEELCALVCIVEGWTTRPGEIVPNSEDPYEFIGWIGGVNLHLHASLYFGFNKKEMLHLFQLVQKVQEWQTDELAGVKEPGFDLTPTDSEDWMLHYTAAVALKYKELVQFLEAMRESMGVSKELRHDILGAIKSTYWWKNMMMSRLIDAAAEGLPPEIAARI